MLDHSCQVQRHPLAERGDDLYGTPTVAVAALLRVEKLPHRLWEPACGHGNIVNVLRAAGHEVLASDLADYGDPTHFYRRDFLMEKLPRGCEGIVTNPPYRLAEQFVAHAIAICPLVVMLMRLAFYESARRSHILENCGLARIPLFSQTPPHDAPRQVGGPQGQLGHGVCVVRVGPQPQRADRHRQNLMGVRIMTELPVSVRSKLANLVRLLAKGEALGAARAIPRILKTEGADTHALAVLIEQADGGKLSEAEMKKLYDAGYDAGRADGVRATEAKVALDEDGFRNVNGLPSWHAMAMFCQDRSGRLRPNEAEFADDMAGWTTYREPTPKQAKWLRSISARLGRLP
jgi:hypothetical protein